MRKLFLSCMALVAACTTVNAQTDSNIFNHMAVGVELGTTGIGVEVVAPVTNYVQVRAGVNYIPTIKVKNIGVDISANSNDWNKIKSDVNELKNQYYDYISTADKALVDGFTTYLNSDLPHDVLIDGEVGMTNFKFLIDVYPFKGSFHLTAGVYAGKSQLVEAYTTNCQSQFKALTYFNKELADKTITVTPPIGDPQTYSFRNKIGVKVGNELLEPNGDHGRAYVNVGGVKPYVGIGFGRAVPQKHRLAFNFDLGAMLWGSPKIFLEQPTGDKEINVDNLDDDWKVLKTVSKLTVYPCMTFRLTGRIF